MKYQAIGAALLSFACAASAQQPAPLAPTNGAGLSTVTGHFVLGVLDSPSGASRNTYLVDTKTGAVWISGCIAWESGDKCSRVGFRPVGFSDGAGGKVFDNAKDAAEGMSFGSLLRK